MRRSLGAVALALVLGSGVGCAKSTPDEVDMAKALQISGVPAAEARCAVDAIFANLSDDQVRQLVERGAGGTPKDNPARTDDAYDKLTKAMTACRDKALGSQPAGGPVAGSATSTTAPSAGGTGDVASSNDPAFDTSGDDRASSTSSPSAGSTDDPSSTSQPSASSAVP